MPKINITGNMGASGRAADIEKAYRQRDSQNAPSAEVRAAIKKRQQEEQMWRDRDKHLSAAERREQDDVKKRTATETANYTAALTREKRIEKMRMDSIVRESRTKKKFEERAQKDAMRADRARIKEEERARKETKRLDNARARDEDRARKAAAKSEAKIARDAERADAKQRRDAERKARADQRAEERAGTPMERFGKESKIAGKTISAVIAGAVEAILLPGQISRSALGMAAPYGDLKLATSGMARAGGFNSLDLVKKLYPGNGTTEGTEWMSRLLLTPESIMDSFGKYGIAQRSAGGARDLAEQFGRENLSRGFSGMGSNVAEKVARQGVGMGAAANSAAGIAGYLGPFRHVMEEAVAKGMDRATVLENIQGGIDSISKNGTLGISPSAITDLFSRFASTNTPGGRTGSAAASAMEGLGDFIKNPGGNTPGMFMLYSQMNKFGGLRTEDDIRKFVGEKNWTAAGQSPGMRDKIVSDITSAAAAKNPYAALHIATTMLMGADPSRVAELQQNTISKTVPGYLQNTALGNTSGMGMAGAYGFTTGTPNGSAPAFGPNAAGLNSGGQNYRDALLAAGVPANLVDHFVSVGQKMGISPALLASIANTESSYQTGAKNPRSGAYGLMQIMPENMAQYGGGPGSTVDQQITAGGTILQEMLKRSGNDVDKALDLYSGGGGKKYVDRVKSSFSEMSALQQVPVDVGGAQNQASQSTLRGAQDALNVLVPIATSVSQGLEHLYSAAERLAKKFEHMSVEDAATMQGNMQGIPVIPHHAPNRPMTSINL